MAVELLDSVVGRLRLRVVATERADGDVHPERVAAADLRRRQRAVTARPWLMVDQVHGCAVFDAQHAAPTEPAIGATPVSDTAAAAWPLAGVADVAIASPGPVAVWAADCAPVMLFGALGSVVGVHAGWKGLASGVIDAAAAALSDRGDSVASAVVGPLIHPCCYEFAADDIERVAAGVHAEARDVTSATATGHRALDVPAAVRSALAAHGISPDVMGECTGCSDRWFSHRQRADRGRHAVVGWTEVVAE